MGKNKILSAVVVLLLLVTITTPKPASAYDMENHYWLKMKLAINCGFSFDQARLIAIGDWAIDVNSDTQPVKVGGGTDSSKWKWHALPTQNPDQDKSTTSPGNQEIKQRQHELFQRALDTQGTPLKLVNFGQYLHYLEDKWSHWGYTTFLGHALDVILPGVEDSDHSHTNPDFYKLMVFDSMASLGKLAKNMGINTECDTSLLPLDTYHSAPEYGQDFPWFSPQEIKRTPDPQKFRDSVSSQLDTWKKSKLVNDNIQISKDQGAQAVAENIIKEIASETGLTVQYVQDQGAFMKVPFDKNGTTTISLPNDTKAALEVIKNYNSNTQTAAVPSWIKNNAKWWSEGQIDDKTFATGIGYLINQGIINANVIASPDSSVVVSDQIQIPTWVKNNAKWWSEGQIGQSDFVLGIQYMVNNDIISFAPVQKIIQNQPIVTNSNLKLRIVDPQGNALDATVQITGNGRNIQTLTDRDGYIDVTLRDGNYDVQIDSQSYPRMISTVQVHGDTIQTITMGESQQSQSTLQGAPDFTVSIDPDVASVEQDLGTYSQSWVNIDSTIQFPNQVKVDISVEPSGVGVTAHGADYSEVQYPGNLQKLQSDGMYHLEDLLYVQVDPYTPPGTYLVHVAVSSDLGQGVVTKTSTLTVNVTPPKTFSVSVYPNVLTIVQGGSVTTDVTATATAPLSHTLYLTFERGSDLNSGLKGSFPGSPIGIDPQSNYRGGWPISPTPGAPVTQTLTITADSNAPLGKHTMWVSAHTAITLDTGDLHSSNMYVPVIVNVIAPNAGQQTVLQAPPLSTPQQPAPLSTPQISADQSSVSFTHTIGVTACPEPIAIINLKSNQPGTWSVISSPSWTNVSINNNSATINFNCQLSQYTTQSLSGDVEFLFTGNNGKVNSLAVSISGQVYQH